MKKFLSLLLTLCLLLGILPSQALAYVGDIISPGSTNVQTSTNNNSLDSDDGNTGRWNTRPAK